MSCSGSFSSLSLPAFSSGSVSLSGLFCKSPEPASSVPVKDRPGGGRRRLLTQQGRERTLLRYAPTCVFSSWFSFLVSWLCEDHDLETEKSPLSPTGEGGLVLFSAPSSQPGTCLRTSQSSSPSCSWSPARAGMGRSHSDRCSPALPTRSTLGGRGAGELPQRPPLQLPIPYLIQGEGVRMGNPVLQGQHPHFQQNQVRKRARSPTLRGSAASAWGAGEMVGAAPPLLTRSPGESSRCGLAQRFSGLQKPSGLGTGDGEGGSRAKGILRSPSGEGDVGEKQGKGFSFPQTVQPHLPSFLPANSLKASANACDGASCSFCRVFGLWCGGAGIQSGEGRRRSEEGTSLATGGTLHPKI